MTTQSTREHHWHLADLRQSADRLDLPRLWLAVRTRRRLVLGVLLAVLGLTLLLLASLTPRYTAQAMLMIERPAPVIRFPDSEGRVGRIDSYLETQLDLLRSRQVAERVVRELQLSSHPEFDPRQNRPLLDIAAIGRRAAGLVGLKLRAPLLSEAEVHALATRQFMKQLDIRLQGKAKLVQISVTMADRLTAAKAANAIADSYIESQLAAKVDMSLTAAGWMNERLQELRAAVEASEQRMQTYLEAEGLVNVNGVTTVSANELSMTGERMIEASRARAEAESQYRQVEAMRGQSWERLASLPAVVDNELVQKFKAEVARTSARLEDLSRRYGARHPLLESARSDLSAATEALKGQVEQVAAGIERTYQLAVANERALRASFNENKAEIQGIGRKEHRVRELQRDVDSHRALHDTFVTRLKETSATSDLSSSNARLVDLAVPPQEPSEPRRLLYLAIASLLGLALGAGAAIVKDVQHDSFSSPDDVEAKLDLPVLGIVPLQPKGQVASVAQAFRQNTDRRFSEAIRTIRTHINLTDMSRTRQVLLITSSEPGEGKSSLAANLAFAMGQLQRVLLIDADLRRATLARNFGFPPGTPGLTNVLTGGATLESAIRRVDGVDLLGAGTVPPNPQELLASPRFAELLKSLRGRYDRILIDSPPTQAVSDAAVLTGITDGVIYVVRADHTVAPLARDGIGQLLQAGARVLGVVLNRFDVQRARKYRQHSGYYDYYGYSEGEATGEKRTTRGKSVPSATS